MKQYQSILNLYYSMRDMQKIAFANLSVLLLRNQDICGALGTSLRYGFNCISYFAIKVTPVSFP